MSRYLINVNSTADRERAARIVLAAPFGCRVEVKAAKRTLPQNDRMWAALTDISNQVDWYGEKLSAEDWKHLITASLKKQRVVPGIDGGLVALGCSTSKMTKEEMSELLELAMAFGAQQGVIFDLPKE